MKKVFKTMLGVTLLEVMLVLAIAAMIIVMSVRYYQSANSSQQANAILQQVQGIVSAANTLAQAQGSYSAVSLGSAALTPLLPGGWNKTPWGETISVAATSSTTFTMNIGSVPSGVCPLLLSKLATDNHFEIDGAPITTSTCTGSAVAVTITYKSNP